MKYPAYLPVRVETMDKARKFGWHGHVQSEEGIKATLEKMAHLRMVPGFGQ